MKIDTNNITLEQAAELAKLFGQDTTDNRSAKNSILSGFIGKYCIVRSRSEGINFGKVVLADRTGVVINSARRIWRPVTENGKPSWYEGVAVVGLDLDAGRGSISVAVEKKAIIENYSLTLCSEKAVEVLINAPSNKTNF